MYLPDLLEGAGLRQVVVARLFIGGCSLERHCREYAADKASYLYSKTRDNRWDRNLERKATLRDGLEDEDWDIITIQQSSPLSGLYESFVTWTERLVEIIRRHCSNPAAVIVWHETWAYSRNATHPDFPRYGEDQQVMYDAIEDCVRRVTADEGLPSSFRPAPPSS